MSRKNGYDEVSYGKVIVEAGNKKSGTKFLTDRAQLVFIKLGQVFGLTSILHHFDLAYSILYELMH